MTPFLSKYSPSSVKTFYNPRICHVIYYVRERFEQVTREMKAWLETESKCFKCSRWGMESVEGTSGGNTQRLDVGFWSPAGPYLKDVLFPNVMCGFRGRVIDVASIEVWTKS